MGKDLWLPQGYKLPDGSIVGRLLRAGEEWQIYDAAERGKVLLARPALASRWIVEGILDAALLFAIEFGPDSFRALCGGAGYALGPVDEGRRAAGKAGAMAFAAALKETRRLSQGASLGDAVYAERYSRLLPTWAAERKVDDAVVLGKWLTCGVAVSAESFRRLADLTDGIDAADLADVVKAAGFEVPPGANMLTKRLPSREGEHSVGAAASRLGSPGAAGAAEKRSAKERAPGEMFKLPGRTELEAFFNEHVVDIVFRAEQYQRMGIGFPSAVVLHGPPGCGKTFAAEKLVEFLDWPSFSIDSSTVASPYIHDTGKKISEIFDKAIDAAPSVLIIDEMESFLSDRRSGDVSGLYHIEEMAEFLRRIPEATKNRVLVIAMTNMIDAIDPAILRRGRFDHVIEVGMPSKEETSALLDSLLSRVPKSDDLNLGPIVDALTGKAPSDCAFVVREAARLTAKAGGDRLEQRYLDEALAGLTQEKRKRKWRFGFAGYDR